MRRKLPEYTTVKLKKQQIALAKKVGKAMGSMTVTETFRRCLHSKAVELGIVNKK